VSWWETTTKPPSAVTYPEEETYGPRAWTEEDLNTIAQQAGYEKWYGDAGPEMGYGRAMGNVRMDLRAKWDEWAADDSPLTTEELATLQKLFLPYYDMLSSEQVEKELGRNKDWAKVKGFLDDSDIRGRWRELIYRLEYLGFPYRGVTSTAKKETSYTMIDALKQAAEDIAKLKKGTPKELIEFYLAREIPALSLTEGRSDVLRKYQYEHTKEKQLERLAGKYSKREKDELWERAQLGEEVPEVYKEYLRQYEPNKARALWHDEKYLASLSVKELENERQIRREQLEAIEALKPEAQKQIRNYWNALTRGEVITDNAAMVELVRIEKEDPDKLTPDEVRKLNDFVDVYMIRPSQMRTLIRLHESYGPDYLDQAERRFKEAPEPYKRTPVLDEMVDLMAQRAITATGRRRELEANIFVPDLKPWSQIQQQFGLSYPFETLMADVEKYLQEQYSKGVEALMEMYKEAERIGRKWWEPKGQKIGDVTIDNLWITLGLPTPQEIVMKGIEAVDKPWGVQFAYAHLRDLPPELRTEQQQQFVTLIEKEQGKRIQLPTYIAPFLGSVEGLNMMIRAGKNFKPSNELLEAYETLPTWLKITGEASNPIWFASAGSIAKITSLGAKALKLTGAAAKLEKAALAIEALEALPAKPIETIASKITRFKEIRQLKTLWKQLGDSDKAALLAVREKEIAGLKLLPEEQVIVSKFKGQWQKIIGDVHPYVQPKMPEGTPLAQVEKMWDTEIDRTTIPFKEKVGNARLALEENISDRFAGINKLSQAARKGWKQAFPKDPFPDELNAELWASLYSGAPEAGRQLYRDTLRQVKEIIYKSADINDVNSYLHLRHFLDVLKMKGNQRLVAGGVKGIGGVEEGLRQLVRKLGNENFKKVKAAAAVVRDTYDNLLMEKVEAGLYSRKLAEVLRNEYPWYNKIAYIDNVILQGGYPGRTFSVTRNDLYRLGDIGLEAMRDAPLNTLARQTVGAEMLIYRNRTARAIVELAKSDPQLAKFIGKGKVVKHSGELKGTLSVYEDGKRVVYDVPNWLEREAKYLSIIPTSSLEKLSSAVLNISRVGMTTANLAFFVPNLAIDSLTALITKGVLPHEVGIALLKNIRTLKTGKGALAELMRSGGAVSGFWGQSPETILKQIRKIGQLGVKSNRDWKAILAKPYEAITALGHSVEMAPRVALFEKELRRGSTLYQAALAARRVTIDFQRSGVAIRQANSFYLYLNAGVQGAMIPFRALRDSPRSRLWLAGYMAMIFGNYSWNRQFPEYEQVPDYAKYGSMMWMLPSEEYDRFGNKVPHYIAVVPNLREFALFSGPMLYALRELDGKDAGSINQFLDAWVPGINPISQILGTSAGVKGVQIGVPTPLFQTILDVTMNWDPFRNRPIIDEELQAKPRPEQYDQYTSQASIRFGQIFNISPKIVDYVIKNIFGGVGSQLLEVADMVLRTIDPMPIDYRIEGLLEQLRMLNQTVPPSKIEAARRDFLYSLSKDDREAVLKLERTPPDRIPVATTIINRIYRTWGSQVWQTALQRTRQEVPANIVAPEDELANAVIDILNAARKGLITAFDLSEALTYHRAYYSGRKGEQWAIYEFVEGGRAAAEVQKRLPPEWRWGPETQALHQYWEKYSSLIEQAGGELDDEKWGEIYDELERWLNTLNPEVKQHVLDHRYDWVADLPDEERAFLETRYQDFETIDLSGYYDMPSGVRNQFLKNPENAELDALLVFWGRRAECSTPEAMQILNQKVKELGVDISFVYGDDLDLRYKQYKWGVPIEDMFFYDKTYKAYDDGTEEGNLRQQDFLIQNPLYDAARCFLSSGERTFPESDAGWDTLDQILKLNNITWAGRYGPVTSKWIDAIRIYEMLNTTDERYAMRRYYNSDFEQEWFQNILGYDSIVVTAQGWTSARKTDIRHIAELYGWL
jgi:hypothetical protein